MRAQHLIYTALRQHFFPQYLSSSFYYQYLNGLVMAAESKQGEGDTKDDADEAEAEAGGNVAFAACAHGARCRRRGGVGGGGGGGGRGGGGGVEGTPNAGLSFPSRPQPLQPRAAPHAVRPVFADAQEGAKEQKALRRNTSLGSIDNWGAYCLRRDAALFFFPGRGQARTCAQAYCA